MPLLEHEINHSHLLGISEAAPHPTPRTKTKTYFSNISVLKETKISESPLHPMACHCQFYFSVHATMYCLSLWQGFSHRWWVGEGGPSIGKEFSPDWWNCWTYSSHLSTNVLKLSTTWNGKIGLWIGWRVFFSKTGQLHCLPECLVSLIVLCAHFKLYKMVAHRFGRRKTGLLLKPFQISIQYNNL